MTFYEKWANSHLEEDDNKYKTYHGKDKGDPGYIPKENFYYDGILFEEDYNKAKQKVLFIAKECNSYDPNDTRIKSEVKTTHEDYWARDYVKNAIKEKSSVGVFLRGLAMLDNAIVNNDYTHPNKNVEVLKNSAMINLNKRGGYCYCVWDTLDGYVNRYKKELREQIKNINPDVIVCCGESVKYLVEKYKLVDNETIKDKDRFKCAFHPSYYSVSDKAKLLFLKDRIKPERNRENTQINTRETRGYILNTNGCDCETEMMNNSKAYAYGDARHFLNWYRKDDYVLFYSSINRGIIAVGRVEEQGDDEKADTSWWTVNPEFPTDFKLALKNKPLPIEAVNRIVYGNNTQKMCMRGTVKRKVITEEMVKKIIDELKKLNQE